MSGLTVLTYHAIDYRDSVISVDPALFRGQMETLAANGISGISFRTAFDHLAQTGRFPANSIILSFDDGYTSLVDEVLPVLQPLGFTGTAFLVFDLIGLNARQAQLISADIDRKLMGWRQIAELMDCGFEMGSHTLRHPDLTSLNAQELALELGESREKLQQGLQTTVDSLAYPYGYVNSTVKNVASEYYRLACTTRLGRVAADADPMLLQRIDAYYLRHPKMFLDVCKGGLVSYLNLRQYLRDIKHWFIRSRR